MRFIPSSLLLFVIRAEATGKEETKSVLAALSGHALLSDICSAHEEES